MLWFGREQPIFTCKAHVFHIDPKTKRSWIPASSSAINVSFFYDSTRSLYRIISVEGTKVRFLSILISSSILVFYWFYSYHYPYHSFCLASRFRIRFVSVDTSMLRKMICNTELNDWIDPVYWISWYVDLLHLG